MQSIPSREGEINIDSDLDKDPETELRSALCGALADLQRTVGVERTSILLLDPDGTMRYQAWSGISGNYRKATEECAPHSQWTQGPQPAIVEDVRKDPSLSSLLWVFEAEEISALASIPLFYQGKLLGKLVLYSRNPYGFKKEVEFARTLGNLIAFAIAQNQAKERQASKEVFRAIFEVSLIGKALVSPRDGRFVRVNRKFSEITGYSPEELRSMTYVDITHPDDRKQSDDLFWSLAHGKSPFHTFDKRYIRKDGHSIWGSVSTAPIRDKLGRIVLLIIAIQDITDRKLSEELRQEALRKYQTLVNSIDGIIWEVTPDVRFTFVSKQAERILGYPIEEWKASPTFWIDHLHPEDREWAVNFCMSRASCLQDHDFEYRMIAADGRVVWLRDIVHVVTENGRLLNLRGVMVDITRQKQIAEDLERSFSLLNTTLESTADGILVVDLNGSFLKFNQLFLKLWQLPPEWIKLNAKNSLLPFLEQIKKPDCFLAKIEEVNAHPEMESYDLIEFKDGRVFERYSRPQRLDNRIVGRVWSFRDATERVRTESELKDLSDKIRTLTTSVSDYLWSAEVDQKGNFNYTYCSPVAQNITGRPPEYYLSGPEQWFSIVHLDDRQLVRSVLEKIVNRQSDREEADYRIVLPDGSIRWVRDSMTVSRLDIDRIRIDGVVSDITERKLYVESKERLLARESQARQEAERAVELRDDFLSIATHELRTPLTPVRMYFQLIKQQIILLGLDPQKMGIINKAIQGTEKELDRFLKLVETLLDVTRIRSRGIILNQQGFDLSEVVKNVLNRFEVEIRKSNCELRVNIQTQVIGRWDQSRIEQVITNLLSNALKYGAHKPIEVTLSKKDAKVLIQIRDYGIGISEKDQEKIFHRFERAASLKHFAGFGLGLFIVREIVEAHGGTIRLESKIGYGSTFSVELPLRI